MIREKKGFSARPVLDTAAYKESQYEKLAAYASKYLDLEYIMELVESGSMTK